MKKIVEYDSKLNDLNFGKFKEKELDLFFSICYKMKNEGTNEILLTFQELKELSQYQNRNIDRFIKDLEGSYDKLLEIKIRLEDSDIIDKFTLFTKYRINKTEKEISIKVNEEYKYILNDISKFTKFDLIDFVSLGSSYSKNMFKILKQYENNKQKEKWYQIKIDKFREILEIPPKYRISDIDARVIKPILEQLKPMFPKLKVDKIKKGVRIDSYKFTWDLKTNRTETIEGIKMKKGLGEDELKKYQELEREMETKKIDVVEISEKEKAIIISKEKFEDMYTIHLKENGISHSKSVRMGFEKSNSKKYIVINDLENIKSEDIIG